MAVVVTIGRIQAIVPYCGFALSDKRQFEAIFDVGRSAHDPVRMFIFCYFSLFGFVTIYLYWGMFSGPMTAMLLESPRSVQ